MEGQSQGYKRLLINPEPEWETLSKLNGTTFLIGATNSGKSTLVQYLIRCSVRKHATIALVDSDIGQSSLGIPGTINMKIFKKSKDIETFHADKTFFIGSLNPAKKIPLMIEGTKTLVNEAKKKSTRILVDTTGLIHGEMGIALKTGKIKSIKPDQIVALEKTDELEHILAMAHDTTVYRLKPSDSVKERSRDMRIQYRQQRFNEYFQLKSMQEFFLNDVDLFYNGRSFSPQKQDFEKGTLIGLNHNEDTKALGILLELDKSAVTFRSPVNSLKGINRVVFSDITIDV